MGGMYVDGRWHTRGHLVTYAAEHAATALLEWLVHLEVMGIDDAPATIPFIEIDLPDEINRDEYTDAGLPNRWQSEKTTTQRLGDTWLKGINAPALFVPSVVVPARNVVLNPLHPDARKIRVVRTFEHRFDPRLLTRLA